SVVLRSMAATAEPARSPKLGSVSGTAPAGTQSPHCSAKMPVHSLQMACLRDRSVAQTERLRSVDGGPGASEQRAADDGIADHRCVELGAGLAEDRTRRPDPFSLLAFFKLAAMARSKELWN